MNFVEITKDNIDDEHICCALGNDKINMQHAKTKKDWMKNCFDDGLRFIRLDDRGKFFVEYTPIEKAWKPVIGENYFLINCLWVSGRFKSTGIGKELLKRCISDAKKNNKAGVAVITASKVQPFLTDKKFFISQGFETVDTAQPYFELLVFKIDKKAKTPKFTDDAKEGNTKNKKGFTFIYSNQCPFTEEYVDVMKAVVDGKNIPTKKIKLKSAEEAQALSTPFGTFGVFYNGNFLTHEIMSDKKFTKLVEKILIN